MTFVLPCWQLGFPAALDPNIAAEMLQAHFWMKHHLKELHINMPGHLLEYHNKCRTVGQIVDSHGLPALRRQLVPERCWFLLNSENTTPQKPDPIPTQLAQTGRSSWMRVEKQLTSSEPETPGFGSDCSLA